MRDWMFWFCVSWYYFINESENVWWIDDKNVIILDGI